MSVESPTRQRPPTPPTPRGEGPGAAFVERRIGGTGRRIKLVELVTALMAWAAGLLALLLAASLLDHWVFGFGFWTRLLVLVAAVGGSVAWLGFRVAPLLAGAVNPVYAAWAIERSEQSLHNSLVNFLLLRHDPSGAPRAIYDAMERRAAEDLSHVRPEAGVDRSRLIRVGYVLAGVMAVFAAYKILSPKDPFQTVARVALPWRRIARPSRVQIDQVRPGDIEAYQGRFVKVTARVRGALEGQEVRLLYSTADGQVVDRPIAMRLSAGGLLHECELPAEADGVQQDLRYRIEAGDAATRTYRVTVRDAPTILVERVEYQFPAYTGLPPRVVEREGDLRALEGSRVTLWALANEPIRSAFLELDPVPSAAGRSDSASGDRRRRVVPLQAAGVQAHGGFTLALKEDRTTPQHAAYQVRFVNQQGDRNDRPVLHQIEVIRDLSPEVEILTPRRDRISVPEDGRQEIRVRAVDPDYALSRVSLRAVCGGQDLLDAPLIQAPHGQSGQVVASYDFAPRSLGLTAGDEVVYWAVAADNRTAGEDESPAPNIERTRSYRIEITPARSASGRPGAEASEKGGRSRAEDAAGARNAQQGPEGAGAPSAAGGGAESPEGDREQRPDGGGQAQQGESSPEADQGDQEGAAGAKASEGSPHGDQSAADRGAPSGEGSAAESASPSSRSGSQSHEEGAAGRPKDASSPSDAPRDGRQAEPPAGSAQGARPEQQQGVRPGERSEPLHDGEVIEKINQYIKDHASRGASGSSQDGAGESGQSPPAAGQQSDSDQSDSGSPQDAPDQSSGGPSGSSRQAPSDAGQPGRSKSPAEESSADQAREGSQEGAAAGRTQESPGAAEQEGDQASESSGRERAREGGPTQDASPKKDANGAPQEQPAGVGERGDAGAGQSSSDQSPAPAPQGANRPREKASPTEGAASEENSNSPPSPSISPRQSDSEGGESGDRSGGGGKGGGQGADREGSDRAGRNRSADQGAGASSESGEGAASSSAGDKQPAAGSTGASARSADAGGSTSESAGDQAGGGANGEADQQSSAGGPGSTGGASLGGGLSNGGQNGPAEASDQETPPGEDANLQYARKATDLALEYLRRQQDHPDPKLLEELRWTKADWRNFLDRWRRLKQAASEDEAARRELDESLRSLGLRPRGRRWRRGGGLDRRESGLRNTGGRSAPPQEYLEQFNAYRKSAARSG